MTISLYSLVDDVRDSMGDVDDDFIKDKVIYKALKLSSRYISKLACPDATIEDLKDAVTSLATYYSYISYVSLSARDLGDVPQEMRDLVIERRRMAYNDILMISCIPITPDLNIDIENMRGSVLSAGLTKSVFTL